MAVTATSSVVLTQTEVSTGDTSYTSITTLEIQMTTDGSGSGDGMLLAATTDSLALGDDTVVLNQVAAVAEAADMYSIVGLDLTLLAAAESDSGNPAFATTDAVTLIGGGFDHFFTLQYDIARIHQAEDYSSAMSYSQVTAFALNVGGVGNLTDMPSPLDGNADEAALIQEIVDMDMAVPSGATDAFQGNLVLWDLQLLASGDDSFAQMDFQAVTVEDQLSLLTASLIVAVA